MATRPIQTAASLLLFIVFSQDLNASDEQPDLDELAGSFVQVIATIESEYNCLFRVVSVEAVDDNRAGIRYWARYQSAGIECWLAAEELVALGRESGILFSQDIGPRQRGSFAIDPLTLIHEINPPIDD